MQFTPHLSPRGIRAGTAILLVSVLALVAACGLSAVPPTATPLATAAANPIVTLVIPSPTATAAPPTATPAPTSAPTVAQAMPTIALPAPTAVIPTAELAAAASEQYLSEMREISGRWEAWSVAASSLMNEIGQDPLAICITRSGDIDAQVAGGRELLAALAAASPPEVIAAQHDRLLSEASAGLDVLGACREALCRRLDAGTALAKLEEVNTHMTNAYAAAEALFAWAQETEANS